VVITDKENTISRIFCEASHKPATQVAFRYKESSTWVDISWPEYFHKSEKAASGLASLGIKRGDRVVILSNSNYKWAVSDLAILGMGCVTVPIYQSATPEDVVFICKNSEAVAIFIEDEGQYTKLKTLLSDRDCSLKFMICFNQKKPKEAIGWQELLDKGSEFLKSDPDFFNKNSYENKLSDPATIVYTSGTTGQPKGVLLLHSCIAAECNDIQNLLELGDKDSTLTFLPFAHIFGRVELWANVYCGWKMCFAESIDRIASNMTEIKPTFMMAVPRIFEKIYGKILSNVNDGSFVKKQIFQWAIGVGRKLSALKRDHKAVPFALGLEYQLAYKLVFSKINERLGGKLRFLVSGGAPLSREISEFFHAAGILILEGYGLTETTAAIYVNTPYKYRFGTVGPALGDTQLKFAPDGEILVKGVKIFKEYFKNPEATKESLDDGWFKTGDIGEVDSEGFLKITDRKKDLIKTAGGKIVAPQKLENLLKANPLISQVVIYGDKMKYLVALITLNEDEARKYGAEHGVANKPYEKLVIDPALDECVGQIIKNINGTLASFETIKKYVILTKDFTIEDGELTPSLKVKRKYLSQKYADIIQSLYS
jgi:long-chain acyl-CoA synthetase